MRADQAQVWRNALNAALSVPTVTNALKGYAWLEWMDTGCWVRVRGDSLLHSVNQAAAAYMAIRSHYRDADIRIGWKPL